MRQLIQISFEMKFQCPPMVGVKLTFIKDLET